MPNGRSGGFYLKPKELEDLLSKCEDHPEVGIKPTKESVTATQLRDILNRCNDDILIEEQDNAWYIMQFPELADWIVVTSKSPLHLGFRHYHSEWRKDWAKKHPRS